MLQAWMIACDACRFANAVLPATIRLTAPFRWNIAVYDRSGDIRPIDQPGYCWPVVSIGSSVIRVDIAR